jgi:hypothetical protein
MDMNPRVLYYVVPYEYAVLLYFFSSGFMLFKDMVKVLAVRMVLTAFFIAFIAIPYWKFVL